MRKDYDQLKDQILVNLIVQNGEPMPMGILYSRYERKVFSQCLYYLNDEQKAEDFTQDIFMKAYARIASFRGKSSFSTWLSAIARNHCLDYKRSKSSKRYQWVGTFSDKDVRYEEPNFGDPTNDDQKISYDKVRTVIDRLEETEKDLLEKKYFDKMSIVEIRNDLGLSSDSAVKMRLKRAREKVKGMYYKTFPTWD